jgi:hypothetical protein
MNSDMRRVPDFRVPSAARMYDYFLGGKDHFQADREAAERVIAAYPETRTRARANRRFLTRAVWYLAEHGIRQYVDLGSGMPTSPTVHEIARQVRPDARVVYADTDPVVATHYRAVCDSDDGLGFAECDIRTPQDILSDPQLTRTIDLSVPVAFLCVAVLHFVPDEDQPKGIVAALRWRMAPGSYLVVSHAVSDDANKDVLSAIADVYQEATAPAVPRTAEAIEEFFTGLDLVEPGLVDVSQWRNDMRENATKIRLLTGVGRKPRDLPAGRNAKIDWKALSKRIGHADVAFTMKQYVQTDLEADREVATTLADLIIGGLLVTGIDYQADVPNGADMA